MKPLGTNEVNEVYKSQVYNTCIVNLFYVGIEKTSSYYLSLFKFSSQPVLCLITVSSEAIHTPSLLNFYSKFCKPNKNFQHCKKAMSIVIWFLIFHAVDIHIFTKRNWSGSGQNYRWTETTLQVAKDWGTMHEVWGLTKSKRTVLLLWFLLGWFNSSRNYLISTFK